MTETITINIGTLIEEYVKVSNETWPRLCAATATSILRPIISRLESLRIRLRQGKIAANQNSAFSVADAMLGRECLISCMYHEAQMWIGLREERPHDAWRDFVGAEQYLQLALRTPAAIEFEHLCANRLSRLQETLFPHMMYMSCGYDHGAGRCTICERPLDECEHVKGRIYGGQVCAEFDLKFFDVDHVAVVEQPMSKHCYMSHQRQPNEDWLDRLSGEIVPREPGEKESEHGGMIVKATLYENRLPIGSRL